MTLIHCDLLTNSQFSHWLRRERKRAREREREKGGPICKSFFFFLAVSSSYICLDQEESPWQHINVCCLLESCLLALIQHTLNLPFLLNGKVKDCIFHVRKERLNTAWKMKPFRKKCCFQVQRMCFTEQRSFCNNGILSEQLT